MTRAFWEDPDWGEVGNGYWSALAMARFAPDDRVVDAVVSVAALEDDAPEAFWMRAQLPETRFVKLGRDTGIYLPSAPPLPTPSRIAFYQDKAVVGEIIDHSRMVVTLILAGTDETVDIPIATIAAMRAPLA